jgi:hypothetical protein
MPEIFIVLFIILSIFGLVNIVRKIIMWLLKYDDGEIITVIAKILNIVFAVHTKEQAGHQKITA